MFDEIKYRIMIRNEKKHYSNLLHQQKKSDKIQKIEPKIDAFAHAYKLYNPYLVSKMPHYDTAKYVLELAKSKSETLRVLSLGSGTADWEIGLLEKEPQKLEFEIVDINEELLDGAKNYAEKHQMKLKTIVADINKIQLKESFYDIVIVQSSLHHFIELEHIFHQINRSLVNGGEFIVIGEVIGRNGERLFLETKEVAQKIFDILPDKFRYNHYTKKIDSEVPDIDHSKNSFESIRSEEVLPLLLQFFKPKEYVTSDAFLSLLLDFRYGPNYNLNDNPDRSLVEMITNLDLYYISNSILKPVCLFGIFCKKEIT